MKIQRISPIHATALALLVAAGGASAQQPAKPAPQERVGPSTVQERTNPTSAKAGVAQEGSDAADATTHLNRAIQVIHQMERDQKLAALLYKSKGVFVVPDSVRVAVGVGARGGAGVLLVRRADGWGTPSFYNMAGVTLGAQLGAEGGAIAFILNDQKALNGFMQANKFSLNADAGLTVVDWSKKGEGSLGWGDITAWSDTEGLFGGATIAVTDIRFDGAETAAYYRKPVNARDVVAGRVNNPRAVELRAALADTGTAAGSAGFGGSSDSKTRSGDSDMRPTRRAEGNK
ncbi:lipid-binding SYLF domain-containing protein [Massilia sp. IC2-477]|uniref:lipid-binding SYLF domain-containing protein n=1 Tax=unclassified Massilia TaxID=2609279 RepID=UPI001D1239CF|nr:MULTISPECIES: lipid-binding SYLF domain-containing protein [unclassified Massilia]MCC2955341.1 lipid-binding SYLF domain-containing protein [Massilia sp. IC2-477]MCC2972582.1 lipid-binding SYLF domain-containing protein [Massilia sp. IC2-476]